MQVILVNLLLSNSLQRIKITRLAVLKWLWLYIIFRLCYYASAQLLSDVCLSVAYIGPNSRPRKTKNWHRGSPRHTSLGHHFQGQKVKGQLVADVWNSQHAGTGATWRINTKTLSTCRGLRHIVSPRAQFVIPTFVTSTENPCVR